MEEKSLIKREKSNIFQKIIMYLKKRIYNKTETEKLNKVNDTKSDKTNNSLNSLDELRIENKLLKLQKDYENGIIKEEEIEENEKKDLLKLYEKQIKSLEIDINNYEKILDDYKTKIIKRKI